MMRLALAIAAFLYVVGAGAICMMAGGVVWGSDSCGILAFLLAIVGPVTGVLAYNFKAITAGL